MAKSLNDINGLIQVSIQAQHFDAGAEIKAIESILVAKGGAANMGAQALFVGLVRGDEPAKAELATSNSSAKQSLQGLDIEHYPAMTQSSIESICRDAYSRWPYEFCRVIHRVGYLSVGEPIVLVLLVSSHRKEAFAACEYVMDYLKTSAPFWKKAVFTHGEQWVDAKTSDADALNKWS